MFLTFDLQGASVVLADLPGSEGEAIARQLGDNAVFVATDVSANPHTISRISLPVVGHLFTCIPPHDDIITAVFSPSHEPLLSLARNLPTQGLPRPQRGEALSLNHRW